MDHTEITNTISVHGLYRSGTNYIRTLIKSNSPIKVLDKNEYNPHNIRQPNIQSRKILVYKTKDEWLESIARRCYDLEAYRNVYWEEGHTKFVSYAGVANETFDGKHLTVLSKEKLESLYENYIHYAIDFEKFLYNDILKDPKSFLINLNIPLNDTLTLHFDKVESSDKRSVDDLHNRYLSS